MDHSLANMMGLSLASGLDGASIGFGGWPIGGDAYGPVSASDSLSALRRAFDLGVTLFDTADIYGAGRSERLIGAFVRGRTERLILATKGGYVDYARRLQDFSLLHLEHSIAKSLRRLNTDRIDIYYLHSPSREVLERGDVFESLSAFQRRGFIRLRGVSVRTADDAVYLLRHRSQQVDIIQVAFNLLDQTAGRIGVFAEAERAGVGIVVRAPLCFGFIAGQRRTSFGNRDHRRRFPSAQIERWISAADRLRDFEIPGGRTRTQAALQFCARQSGVSATIVGIKNRRQAEENATSLLAAPLTTDELERMRDNVSTRNNQVAEDPVTSGTR